MSARSLTKSPRVFDLPLAIGLTLTLGYYCIVLLPFCHDTLLHRYTTHHMVEYAVVMFFFWGLSDVALHLVRFQREFRSLKQPWLPRGGQREPVSRAGSYLDWLESQPQWIQRSRLGKRYAQILIELEAKGSTEGLDDYMRHLADLDFEQTQANYALLRFQCWVMPMFGFLGTVIHFGTALSGHTSGTIADHLSVVMDEMGTAFNTTTVALIAATTMMFCVFLCERVERGIVQAVDDRVDVDLANRFEKGDVNMAPFLAVVQRANEQCLQAIETITHRQTEQWTLALERLEERFAAHDEHREQRLARLLDAFQVAHAEQRRQLEPAAASIAECKHEIAQLVGGLTDILRGRGELVALEDKLAENLRLLRETRQIDQALHGLTGAIHLLTARGGAENRAA
jgi:biopolymer transport protein ExbB/TolQ